LVVEQVPIANVRRARTPGSHHTYEFGDFVLDVDRGVLLRDGAEVRLRRLSFEVLRYLVEHRDRLVTREELFSTLWAGTVGDDGALTQCLIDVRRALGDESRQVIRTVPRRGYAFAAPVVERGGPGADADAAGAGPAARPARPHLHLAAAAVVLVALAGAAVAWWTTRDRAPDAASVIAGIPRSIAVLPFADMSEERDQAHLSDGIAEEILNLLARSSDLHVIGRTSSFSFKGSDADIAAIARRLNVAWVLEGSVRRSGDRIRIAARLVDARTGLHRWSETYDRDLGNVLDLEADVAAAVARSLQAVIPGGSADGRAETVDPEAYALYLEGRYLFHRRAAGDLDRAAERYRAALAREPALAAAWAGLAGVYWVLLDGRALSPAEKAQWREAVEQALALAPDLRAAQARAGQYFWHAGDRERARAHFARADALDPDPDGAAVRDMFGGRLDAIIEWYGREVTRDPLSAVTRHNFAVHLVAAGRLEEALAEFERALELNPGYREQFDVETALVFILQRRLDDALARIARLPEGEERDAALALAGDAHGDRAASDAALARLSERPGSQAARRVAEVYAQRGDIEAAFRWLEKGRREATGAGDLIDPVWLTDVRISPFLAPLHDDPRWRALMALSEQFT
jgi:TolB-like protein/DNA-binding winged helix-turn-helix (wHTH) protein/Tfp pilus assembly protein PilF